MNFKLVDIDEDLLKNNRFRAQPINHDFIDKREHPFHVEVLRGSVDVFSEKMRHLDAFVAIELIEHLYPLELERLPYNVFHLIKPQIAIFTTPNSDFNVLFASLPAHNFRHDDHKFEWSREQFREWAENLAQRFPDYSVSIQGIGPAPEGSEDHGCCSQAAVFVRNTESSTEVEADDILNYNREAVVKTYEVVMECDFPFDQRSKEQKIGDLAMYHINLMEHRARMDREFDCDELKVEIPLQKIISFVLKEYSTTLEELECILKERKVEIRDQTVIVESDEEYSNEDEEMY
ncbi:small RNA 2'-O-methyltransferase [Phlebotomus argentipes]|uniref:small RNA 2'-O-methyltransferase n=1 Tax=Phlebotomus argentipes TaxID=94469 RepID=UPI0028931435|nr:small RNA 2'-O-methyltransferase [Phlebotomus argentipes]